MDYLSFTQYYVQLEKTSKRLEKTHIVSNILKDIKTQEEAEAVIHLLRGSVFPEWDERKIGISEKLVIKALAKSSGVSPEKIEKLWAKIGDLGEVSQELFKEKKQKTLFSQGKLTIKEVYNDIRKIATLEGEGTVGKKLDIICRLLANADGQQAKFITRTLLEDLRIGVGEGVLRDALVWNFFSKELDLKYNPKENDVQISEEKRTELNKITDKVQQAYDWTNDFTEVFWVLHEKGLLGIEKLNLKIGRPANVMLAIKAEDIDEAIEALGLPVLCDYKLDGFRVQIHNTGKDLQLYTRRLENVTNQFKELVPILKEFVKAKSYILDAEIVGYDPKTKKYLPFQQISQRIKRKYDIEELAKKIPVEISVFDIINKDGKDLTNTPQKERRQILEKTVTEKPGKIILTNAIIAKNKEDIEKFYKEALQHGVEGIIIKNLEKEYSPGRKVGGWMKLKPVLENLDVVIVKAEHGTGKRAGVLSSYTIACLSKDKSQFLEIGKVATGVKEKEEEGVSFEHITKLLKPFITKTKGREVEIKPKIVIEVAYEEVQKSQEYSSGYALRFPRFIRLRVDERKPEDINTLQDVERIYEKQRGRKLALQQQHS